MKMYCDICGKEIDTEKHSYLEVIGHWKGRVDEDGDPVIGPVTLMCADCYDKAVRAARDNK